MPFFAGDAAMFGGNLTGLVASRSYPAVFVSGNYLLAMVVPS